MASTKPSTQQWQKFVAATDTAVPKPATMTTTVDEENGATKSSSAATKSASATTKSASATTKSVSATSVEPEQKDEIDMKLQDFLAVSSLDLPFYAPCLSSATIYVQTFLLLLDTR